MSERRSDALVLFGVTGDLAHKMIFPALYAMAKRGTLKVPLIGVALPKWSLERLRGRVTDSIKRSGGIDNQRAFDHLLSLISYVSGDYNDPGTFTAIKEALSSARRPAYYLAIPPALFETVIKGLGAAKLSVHARVIVEKPFGRDLASARELNRAAQMVFPQDSIFRIDHFLGKEAIVRATDGEIGHVADFLIDSDTWAIRYLVIDTRHWWPGKDVLVAPRWIEHVSWSQSKVFVNLLREDIKQSPEYTSESLATRDYETALHQHYQRQPYWVEEPAAREHFD